MSLLHPKPSSDIWLINTYKALFHLAFQYLSDLISFHSPLCFLPSCHIGLAVFPLTGQGLSPSCLSLREFSSLKEPHFLSVFAQKSLFSEGHPGPSPTCHSYPAFVYDVLLHILFLFIYPLFVCLDVEYISPTKEGIVWFFCSLREEYPGSRAFFSN